MNESTSTEQAPLSKTQTASKSFRNAVGATLAAYALSQILIAVAALVRIPLLLDYLGEAQFGFFMVLLGFWPWLNAVWEGLKQAARVRSADDEAEQLAAAPRSNRSNLGPVSSACWVLMIASSSVLLLVGLLPVLRELGVATGLTQLTVLLSVGALGLVTAICCPLAVTAGSLEFRGATARVNLSYSTSALLGLPGLLLAIHLDLGFLALILITALSYGCPLIALRLYKLGREHQKIWPRFRGATTTGSRTVREMTVWSVVGILGSGLDTLVVAFFLGTSAAGTYAVTQRVLALALIIPTALGGLVTAHFIRLRLSNTAEEVARSVRKAGRLYLAAGVLVGGLFVLLAPAVIAVITRGQLTPPPSLVWAMGAVTVTQFATSPYFASMTTIVALRLRIYVIVTASSFNVALTFILSHYLGLPGPALATAIVGAGSYIACVALTRPAHTRLYDGT